MKKKILMFTSMLAILLLVACSSEEKAGQENTDGNLTVFTTIYPLQYFTERVGGDFVTTKTIVPPGSDAHSAEVDLKIMAEVAESDAFIHTGTGLESFADSVADSMKNEEVLIVNATENLNFINSKDVHSEEEDEEHSEELDIDPHVWLDPKRSIVVAENIKNALIELNPDKEKDFENNFALLKEELEKLDSEFQTVVNESKNKTFIVSHSAYGYWEDAYGLTQIGINGMAPTSEPSQKQLTEIIKLAKDNDLKYIFFEPNVSNKVAEIVKAETGTEALMLNNLESLTDENQNNNEDYFVVMRKNIEALEQALN
ncbi:metal ABC transporter solute-binding protein, Zn/Mn family [Peribacillus asahii]|uniref:metal ABC transporter solute-binding protein, Zn/Mn family n=1 Tax=Peribacillus asahii TaxID=228899 RepID=UPI00207ABD05|nr:zinc ABC transporter substrate-binding protein [Peribacillus asahii]USK62417.1 zinc ABC transporter substrate-binding protein [Peribacillus asahii]